MRLRYIVSLGKTMEYDKGIKSITYEVDSEQMDTLWKEQENFTFIEKISSTKKHGRQLKTRQWKIVERIK